MAEIYVGLENNQKILIPTSSEARSGNPLGTILAIHSNAVPYGYLPCNGVAFDENQYPALYALLGDNHTPVEGHTLDWDNAESITLSTSDYVVQKNGWLVGYALPTTGYSTKIIINNITVADGAYVAGGWASYSQIQIPVQKGDVVKCDNGFTEQFISLVPYKYYKVIKATSGLEETQQDYVLQSLLEADNYSTEEVATGKKWIDGKMIYKKTFYNISLTNGLELQTGVNELINQYGTMTNDNTVYIPFPKDTGVAFCTARLNVSTHKVVIDASNTYSGRITLEYTKAD